MKCSKCGTEFASGKFCPECGQQVGVCPECGTKRADSSKFCNECGYRYPQPTASSSAASMSADDVEVRDITPSGEQKQAEGEPIAAIKSEDVGGRGAETAQTSDNAAVNEVIGNAEQMSAAAQISGDNGSATNAIERKPFSMRNFIEGVKAKIGVSRINAVYRWLPASLALIYGFLILLFMLAPAVRVDFLGEKLAAASGFGVMGGEYGASAAVGAVFLLLISLGFIATGAIRMYLAIKYPYYKPFLLGVIQMIMYCVAFVMSCVMVGGCNTDFTNADAAGICVLIFTLFGFFFIGAGTYLFKADYLPELCSLQYSAAEDFKRDWAAAKARRLESKSNVLAAAAVVPAAAVSMAVSDDTVSTAPAINYAAADDYEAKVYNKQNIPSKVKSYRYAPAIISILYTAFMLIMMSLPVYGKGEDGMLGMGSSSGTAISGTRAIMLFFSSIFSGGAIELTGIFWFVEAYTLVLLWIFSLVRLSKAISKPYSKMPILTVFQTFLLMGITTISTLNMLFGAGNSDYGFIFCIIAEVITGMYLFFGVLTGMCANTDENRYYIKRARAAAHEGKKMKRGAKAALIAVMFIVYALALCLQFVPFGDRGFDTNTAQRIQLGMSKSEVESILGKPYEDVGDIQYYYTKKYIKIFGKEDEDEDIDIDDFDNLEGELGKAEKEEAKREEQIKKLEYKYYKIVYDSKTNTVESLMFDNMAFGDESRYSAKSVSNIVYNGNDGGSVSCDLKSDTNYIDVVVRYTDGSIEKRRVRNVIDYLSDIDDINTNKARATFTYYPMFDGVEKQTVEGYFKNLSDYVCKNIATSISISASGISMRIGVNDIYGSSLDSVYDFYCYKFTPATSGYVSWSFRDSSVKAEVYYGEDMRYVYVSEEDIYLGNGNSTVMYTAEVTAGEVYYIVPYSNSGISSTTLAIRLINPNN